MQTSVEYDSSEKLFNVYVNKPEQTESLEQQLNTIQQKAYFADAFIENTSASASPQRLIESENVDFTYQIHVKGVSKMSKEAYLNQITDKTDLDLSDRDLHEGSEEELIVFENLTNWEQTLQLRQ